MSGRRGKAARTGHGSKKGRGRKQPAARRQAPRRRNAPAGWSSLRSLALAAGGAALAVIVTVLLWKTHPEFDEARAFDTLAEYAALGPRVPGSAEHQAANEWLFERLGNLADRVSRQHVLAPVNGDTLRGTNLIASFNLQPSENFRIMLSAHWDSRPWADHDPDTTARRLPVPGVNDGGSGVAVLLEIARALAQQTPDYGVDLLFFDLEDSGRDSTVAFALGSDYFVKNSPDYRPRFGINVDMVCDSTLQIPKEANSVQGARGVVDVIWSAAEAEDADAFRTQVVSPVYDDHVAFLQRGIRVVDLIHIPFPQSWHTLDDTIEHCSSASLGQVGRTLLRVIYDQ